MTKKTEYIVLGSKYAARNIPESIKWIRIGDVNVSANLSVCNIGVKIDQHLSMEKQVASVTRSCYTAL